MGRENELARGRGLRTFYGVFLASCSILCAASPARAESGRKLLLLVHGYGGAFMADHALKQSKNVADIQRAMDGDYAAVGKTIRSFVAETGRSDLDIFTFKYDTFKNSNIESGRILNLALKGFVKTKAPLAANVGRFNQLPAGRTIEDYDQVLILTLSNGNLVAREAILQALGRIDDTRVNSHGNKNYAKVLAKLDSDTVISPEVKVDDIKEDEELKAFYAKSTVFDVSPILGGAADARGAIGFKRHREVDPFGKRNQWIFSDENIAAYDAAVQGRHSTFLLVGDHHTRGLWSYWCDPQQSPMNIINVLGTFAQGKSWNGSHEDWLRRFELARGRDADHHVEFVQNFKADERCTVEDYLHGNSLFNGERARAKKFLSQTANRSELAKRLFQRTENGKDYFMEIMKNDPNEFFVEDMIWVHGGDSYSKSMRKEFYKADGTFRDSDQIRLTERHSVLVFYKPMIERIGVELFGSDFSQWLKRPKQDLNIAQE